MIEEITVRYATQADLSALEWNGEYIHFRRLYQEVYDSSFRGEALLWVAEMLGAGVIGQLFIQLTSARKELANGRDRAYIYGFRIQSAYRGHGLGTHMLDVAESDLFNRGFRTVVLNVGRENVEARQLYERKGYRIVATEPGQWSYLDESGTRRWVDEPAWRMEKELYLLAY